MSIGWGTIVSVSLAELAEAIGFTPHRPAWRRIEVTGLCEDSRDVRPGELFIALSGAVHDGADHIAEAVAGGAVAVVSERRGACRVPRLVVRDARAALAQLAAAFYCRPTERLFALGVTGTNGKTTVCHWIAHMLGVDRTVLIGTLANAERDLAGLTTPSSRIVQAIADEALSAGAQRLVVEASSIGLAQRRLDAVDFDVAVFTNLSRDHLDLHGTMEGYLEAKRILFTQLKPSATAVVNRDDPVHRALLDGCRANVIRYGGRGEGELLAVRPRPDRSGWRFGLRWRGVEVPAMLPHGGEHNLYNALAAAGAAVAAGLPIEEVAQRLATTPQLDGRMQLFARRDGLVAVVDFAHTPDALERVLRTVRPPGGRVWVVFGCPGRSDRGKRPLMGAIAARHADVVVLTSDNPKDEDAERILDEIEVGVRDAGGRGKRIADRAAAIAWAAGRAAPGDVLLIAGKGHERFQILGDRYLPYADRAVLEREGFTIS